MFDIKSLLSYDETNKEDEGLIGGFLVKGCRDIWVYNVNEGKS